MSEQKKYSPSSGTEGMWVFEKNCANCKHDTEENACEIIMMTMLHDTDESEYPKEWIYKKEEPTCTAYTKKEDKQ